MSLEPGTEPGTEDPPAEHVELGTFYLEDPNGPLPLWAVRVDMDPECADEVRVRPCRIETRVPLEQRNTVYALVRGYRASVWSFRLDIDHVDCIRCYLYNQGGGARNFRGMSYDTFRFNFSAPTPWMEPVGTHPSEGDFHRVQHLRTLPVEHRREMAHIDVAFRRLLGTNLPWHAVKAPLGPEWRRMRQMFKTAKRAPGVDLATDASSGTSSAPRPRVDLD